MSPGQVIVPLTIVYYLFIRYQIAKVLKPKGIEEVCITYFMAIPLTGLTMILSFVIVSGLLGKW